MVIQLVKTCRVCDKRPIGIDGVCPTCWLLISDAIDRGDQVDLTEFEVRLSADRQLTGTSRRT